MKRRPFLARLIFVFWLLAWPSISGADFHPGDAETQRTVEKGLRLVAEKAAASPATPFVPVAFLLVKGGAGKKAEWRQELVMLPSATVVPDFPQKALTDLQKKLSSLKAGKHIESYFIIHEADNKLSLIVREGDAAEKTFAAPYASRDEIKNLRAADFKPQ